MSGIKRAQVAADAFEKEVKTEKPKPSLVEPLTISTGSTLLDLAIYGGRKRGGGIPGGIIIEIFSKYGLGKTALASEICGNIQAKEGDAQFRDPEGRLDIEYAEMYGVHLPGDSYQRLHYVNLLFEDFMAWDPPKDRLNAYVCDSLAALTTKLEMTKGDKMGMRRAKELSEGLRKASVLIAEGHKILVCTNQLREGDKGSFTPGGNAVPYWSSVRIELKRISQYTKGIVNKSPEITKTIKVGKNREIEKTIGIRTMATIVKNSKDDPWRTAPVSFVFQYGIDNTRDSLQYVKDILGNTTFECPDGKSFISLDDAISYTEENNLEEDLKETVIDIWEEVEDAFREKAERKKKQR